MSGKSKKLSILSGVLTMLLLVFAGCNPQAVQNQKPMITVSILPQKYFVDKIAGDRFDVRVLIPPGVSPESFDPTVKQIRDFVDARIFFKTGHFEFERNLLDKFAVEYPELKIIDTSKGLNLLENNHQVHHHLIEPHIWMSPLNVKVMAENIYRAISEFDHANDTEYRRNYHLFIREIDSLDLYIEKNLEGLSPRSFLIYHPALTYYARDYQLKQISLEIDGKSPGTEYLRNITDMAKTDGIRMIFVQRQVNSAEAEVIANEINGKIVIIDPLDYDWRGQLIYITDELKKSLQWK